MRENNRARDIFRRRSAVIGFRAAMAIAPCYVLRSNTSRDLLTRFAIGVADLVLRNQLQFGEEELNNIIEKGPHSSVRSKELFASLPDEFTLADVSAALRTRQMKTPPRGMVYLWKRENMAEATDEPKKFRKIKTKKDGTQP